MITQPYFQTIEQLSHAKKIPSEYIPACHLIYSSPATLSYNSPGALGFGVKRAGLVIPESVMLLISPASCGRNSTILSAQEGYAKRMFYLLMSETDLVTGRHLKKIPQAIEEILEVCDPKVVVLCITCVDALLATDLEHIAKQCQEKTGVIVVPSYMYALEREGRKPPMMAIRQTIYSLLKRDRIDPRMVNLMGFFSPIDSELIDLLQAAGLHTINQVSTMKTLEAYYTMGQANFNLVLDPESIYAAEDLKKRLGMPYIELPRLYDVERVHRLYHLFGQAIGVSLPDESYYVETKEMIHRIDLTNKKICIGEMCNANPFELACAVSQQGAIICEIFANVTDYDKPWIQRLEKTSSDTKVYTGISPTMIHYEPREDIDFVIGKDASDYYPEVPAILWNAENQPYGYKGIQGLYAEMEAIL